MRAEDKYSVNFKLSELDQETGVYLTTKRVDWDKSLAEEISIADGRIMGNDPMKLVAFKQNGDVQASDIDGWKLYVYDQKGRYVGEYDANTVNNAIVSNGYTVEIELIVDGETAGSNLGAGADGIDDRNQAVITVVFQHAVDSSLYDRPTAASYYVVNKGENVQKLIEDGDYDNFPGWNDGYSYTYDSDSDKEYVRAYDNALTNVTKDIEVKANWVEDKAGLDRFAPAKDNGPVDLDGDGKISCDEYYGTTGLEWSDKLNACVVSSTGDAVVTIPNTATK